MSKVLCAVRMTVTIVTVLVIGSFIVTGVATGIPSVFGYRLFFIMSESMEPTIHTHQFVIGKAVYHGEPQIGDVVAYEKGDFPLKKVVIHRIIGVTEEGLYLLKGDNNEVEDLPAKKSQIAYKIVRTRW